MALLYSDPSAVPGPAPILLSHAEFRRLLGPKASDSDTNDLTLYLRATDELVASIVGPLTGPIPARWHAAARLIAVNLWDHWQGAVPEPYQTGSDGDAGVPFGVAIPAAAQELLKPPGAPKAGPQFSFPAPALWPS